MVGESERGFKEFESVRSKFLKHNTCSLLVPMLTQEHAATFLLVFGHHPQSLLFIYTMAPSHLPTCLHFWFSKYPLNTSFIIPPSTFISISVSLITSSYPFHPAHKPISLSKPIHTCFLHLTAAAFIFSTLYIPEAHPSSLPI